MKLASPPRLSWTRALANAITDPQELIALLRLDPHIAAETQQALKLFPLKVTRSFVARMEPGDPTDPLLRQVLPINAELESHSDFQTDPLNEKHANKLPGLLHKYHGRVLLLVTGACGINCRFCFRRNFAYSENNPGQIGWEEVFAYLAADPTIEEVIFSGGDPLLAPDNHLQFLHDHISQIKHIRRLRIHSRMPIVLPERIDQNLLKWLASSRLDVILVTHCNHANEIDQHVAHAMHALKAINVTLLNQTVLLHGVNDTATDLINLSKALFKIGILPYYLHMLDKVAGCAHFAVNEADAKQLACQLAKRLPGYLVPKLVKEVAGYPAKVPIVIEPI